MEYNIPENELIFVKKVVVGNCLDDYMILQSISNRENKFVAKVKCKLNNEIYIMKGIDKNVAYQEQKDIYLSREELFLKLLKHENIVKYITSFEENHFLYIITEYVDNGDLLGMIESIREKNYEIDEEKLIKIFLQCLKALSYIHSCGVILKALRPQKILIDNENNIKFTNFKRAAIYDIEIGKAQLNVTEEQMKILKDQKEVLATQNYRAPEMKLGSFYDKKVDIYSLGIIFSYLANENTILSENNGTYSKELKDLIEKMTEKEAIKRPTAEEAYQELKNIFLMKYAHYTGIISSLRCLTSLPNINNHFLNSLVEIKQQQKDSILKQFINFIIIINSVKQTYFNSQDDFGLIMEKKLNLAIYDFLELLHKRGCINLYKNNEISPLHFLSLLFSLLERELKLNFLNVEIAYEEIIKGEQNNSNLNNGKEKIKTILNYFYILKSIISQNFSIISERKRYCTNCNKASEFFKKNQFIVFNLEKIKKFCIGELNVKNAFESFEKNVEQGKYCDNCKKRTEIHENYCIYNTSKNLIILFDRGENCKHKDLLNFEMQLDLGKKYIELMRGNYNLYSYQLYGVIVRIEIYEKNAKNKRGERYIYYTRDLEENFFTRNDFRDTYNLTQIKSEGDVMALFYYFDGLDKKKSKISQNILESNNISINNNVNAKSINNNEVLNCNTKEVLNNKYNRNFNINDNLLVFDPNNNINLNPKQDFKNFINKEANNDMILNKDYLDDNSHPINNIFENNNINYSNDGQH